MNHYDDSEVRCTCSIRKIIPAINGMQPLYITMQSVISATSCSKCSCLLFSTVNLKVVSLTAIEGENSLPVVTVAWQLEEG